MTILGAADDLFLGATIASAGDFNGDGSLDVFIGTKSLKFQANGPGDAYLYLGGVNFAGACPVYPCSLSENDAPSLATPLTSIMMNMPAFGL